MAAAASRSSPDTQTRNSPPNYTLQELVGTGSFSEVSRATHNETNEVIALKNFRQKMRSMAHYRTAANEIAYMEIFEHPNIIPLKLYEINKTFVYIGTEFAHFGSLRTYLNQRQPVSETVIKSVMKQLLSPLCYLHEMGILHGDIKPENMLCTGLNEHGPVIKICDFGLSEIKLKGNDNMLFKSGSFMYMAPEVHLRYPVDCTCDLWSAGIVMYMMMFQRTIFKLCDKDRERHIAYLKRRLPPIWQGAETYSLECLSLVKNLLSYDKHMRATGTDLRKHVFLNIDDPIIPDADTFLGNAQRSINSAFDFSQDKKYGDALVQGIKAVINLKVYYNIKDNLHNRKYLERKWAAYEVFNSDMERALVLPENVELSCPETCSDSQLRSYLASTPTLLHGYDIGCEAEMFLKEGHKNKALGLFHQALQVLLPLMKQEPKSNRKEILGKKLKKWIEDVEGLSGMCQSTSQGQVGTALAVPSTSAGPVPFSLLQNID